MGNHHHRISMHPRLRSIERDAAGDGLTMSRRNPIEVDEKNRKRLEKMLLGDASEALKAKQELHMTAARLERSDPAQAKMLRILSRRVRIKI